MDKPSDADAAPIATRRQINAIAAHFVYHQKWSLEEAGALAVRMLELSGYVVLKRPRP